MCLQAQGIYDNAGVVNRVRQSRRLSDDNGGVGRGQGIDNVSEESETTIEAAGARRQEQGIYNDDGVVGRRR